jgi:hypothetical protein
VNRRAPIGRVWRTLGDMSVTALREATKLSP